MPTLQRRERAAPVEDGGVALVRLVEDRRRRRQADVRRHLVADGLHGAADDLGGDGIDGRRARPSCARAARGSLRLAFRCDRHVVPILHRRGAETRRSRISASQRLCGERSRLFAQLHQRRVVAHLVEHHLHRHADVDLVVGHADEVGVQARALVELDDGDVVGRVGVEGRVLRLMHHDPAVHRAAAAQLHPFGSLRQAAGAEERRREADVPAVAAALHAQLALERRLPERRAVLGRTRQRLFDGEHDLLRGSRDSTDSSEGSGDCLSFDLLDS